MLAFKQSRQHHFDTTLYNIDDSQAELDMNHYGSFDQSAGYASLPYPYYENPTLFVEAPLEDTKYDLSRSLSSAGSLHQHSQSSNEHTLSLISSASGPSLPSASSSTVGSPHSGHSHPISSADSWTSAINFNAHPAIANSEGFVGDYSVVDFGHEHAFGTATKLQDDFVDPSLLQGPQNSFAETQPPYNNAFFAQSAYPPVMSPTASPIPFPSYVVPQYAQPSNYVLPHSVPMERRPSLTSHYSSLSHQSPTSSDFDDETKEKGRCPYPDCGRIVKDLKAHIITHQSERPEKCPVPHCEYSQKGFARKYDRMRHTLTHYKGTMVCGFCPGSGSSAEKSFNRADVFKRHLTSLHGVEQTPPNSRKRSPGTSNKKLESYCQDATGKCSTCSASFSNAQDFYEHLDDCVLRVVQQEEDSEAVNAMQLSRIATDADVKETLERHMLNPAIESTIAPIKEEPDDEEYSFGSEEDDEEDEELNSGNDRVGNSATKSKAGAASRAVLQGGITKSLKKGLTRSKGGGALVGKGRKKRKHYPPSWGMSADKMSMKKRVLCVYDGQRRLWKDDIMMHNEFEVRMKLADGKSYVTDLDVETMKRAVALHNATDEEKGPWNPDEVDIEELMAFDGQEGQ